MIIIIITCLDGRLLLTLTKPLTIAIIANIKINENLDIISITITIYMSSATNDYDDDNYYYYYIFYNII